MAAQAFFETYKELFEYTKHVGTDDPVAQQLRDGSGIGAKTFLDRYRECEQRQAMEMRAAVSIPLASTLAVDSIMVRAPRFSQLQYYPHQHYHDHLGHRYLSDTVAPMDALATRSVVSDSSVTTAMHQLQLYEQTLPQQPQEPISRAKTPVLSSLTRSRLESSLRQSAISSNQKLDDDKSAIVAPAFSSAWATSSLQTSSPERTSPQYRQRRGVASPNKVATDAISHLDLMASALAAAVRSHQLPDYQPPKLADLLIDSSTRSRLLRQRHVDEAKKIELLIGSNCGGRISATAAATSLPPAVRRRLQASHRATQRREQLYTTLRAEYDALCAGR